MNSFVPPPPIEMDWENNVWSRGASALAIQQFFGFESAAVPAQRQDRFLASASIEPNENEQRQMILRTRSALPLQGLSVAYVKQDW